MGSSIFEDQAVGNNGLAAFLRTAPPSRSGGDGTSRAHAAESAGPEPRNTFALPPRHDADALLELYFSTVNLMIPFIHEESFRVIYRRVVREGTGVAHKTWLAILNMLFALATNVSTPTSPPRERAEQSNIFFERAIALSKAEFLGRPSLELSSYPCLGFC